MPEGDAEGTLSYCATVSSCLQSAVYESANMTYLNCCLKVDVDVDLAQEPCRVVSGDAFVFVRVAL